MPHIAATLCGKRYGKYQAAYFAGLIDGEGCIQVRAVNATARSRKPSFSLSVSLSMTDPTPVHALAEFMRRGRGRYRTRRTVLVRSYPDRGYKDRFQLTFAGKHAARLLERLVPFLLAKRPQAQLGLRFYHGWHNGHKGDVAFGQRYNLLLKAAKQRAV